MAELTTTYGIKKTMLAIHTEDRDITKWASPTHFEIDLAVSYKNVRSIRLADIELPVPLYVFSNDNQNTKMSVALGETVYSVEISKGNYTPAQLCTELAATLNSATESAFEVLYNQVTRQITVLNAAPFTLRFDIQETYEGCGAVYYQNYVNWGLGSYLGFDKVAYTSNVQDVVFRWDPTFAPRVNVNAVVAPFILNYEGDKTIYMELATYNCIDEIQPYQEKSSNLFYGTYGGKHNASFARIPLQERSSKENYLLNIFFSDPPLERLQKLRFSFRYHDGRAVHFNGQDFSFSIELTTFRNESLNSFNVNKSNYKLS